MVTLCGITDTHTYFSLCKVGEHFQSIPSGSDSQLYLNFMCEIISRLVCGPVIKFLAPIPELWEDKGRIVLWGGLFLNKMTDCVKGYGVCSVILIPTNDFKASGNDLQLVSCGQQIGDGVVENSGMILVRWVYLLAQRNDILIILLCWWRPIG